MWGATRALASAKHLAGSVRSLCTTVSPVVSRAAKCSDAPVMTPTTQDTLALVENTLGPLSLSPMVRTLSHLRYACACALRLPASHFIFMSRKRLAT